MPMRVLATWRSSCTLFKSDLATLRRSLRREGRLPCQNGDLLRAGTSPIELPIPATICPRHINYVICNNDNFIVYSRLCSTGDATRLQAQSPGCSRSHVCVCLNRGLPGNSTVEIRSVHVSQASHGEVLLRVKSSTICRSDIRATSFPLLNDESLRT